MNTLFLSLIAILIYLQFRYFFIRKSILVILLTTVVPVILRNGGQYWIGALVMFGGYVELFFAVRSHNGKGGNGMGGGKNIGHDSIKAEVQGQQGRNDST
jgi:hypothetical protein